MGGLEVTEFGTFPIDGHLQRVDGSQWSLEQDRAFMLSFLDWLEKQGLGFGGAIGNASPVGGHDPLDEVRDPKETISALLRCESCEDGRHDACVGTPEECACYANNSRHLETRARIAMSSKEVSLLDYVSIDHSRGCKMFFNSQDAHRGLSCKEAHPCDCDLVRVRGLIRLRLMSQKVRIGV